MIVTVHKYPNIMETDGFLIRGDGYIRHMELPYDTPTETREDALKIATLITLSPQAEIVNFRGDKSRFSVIGKWEPELPLMQTTKATYTYFNFGAEP